jgi:hypothetical protein
MVFKQLKIKEYEWSTLTRMKGFYVNKKATLLSGFIY